ncbi:MAG: OmpH family outer membrane protein [candidate division Zixibacteria bacterium]|nr:OmpH family outer membrane protein [candidate division Zixibacteria bacterium]
MVKLTKICLLGALLLITLCGTAMAQRFAYIDSEKIINNFSELQRANEQFQTEYRAWEEEAAQIDQELRDMLAEYEKQKLILSADKKAEREAAITSKQQLLETFTRDIGAPGGRAERRQQELIAPLYEKVTAAIEAIAIDEGYDFVFNSNGLAYAKKDLDITDKVLEKLEEGE